MPIKTPGNGKKKEDGNNPNAFKAAAKNAGVKAWKEARKQPPRPSFGEMLPKGRYEAKLTKMVCSDQDFEMEIAKGKKQKIKIPVVRFNFVVTSGDYKGASVTKWINLRPESVEHSEYDYADLSETLQNLGEEVDATDLAAIPDIADRLTEEQPDVMIYADVRSYKNRKGEDKEIQRIRVNGLIEAPPSDTEEEQTEETEAEESEAVDPEHLDNLGAVADDEDDSDCQAARDELTGYAEQLDIDPNAIDTWTEVAEAIKEATAEEEEQEEEEEEEEAEEEKPQPRKPVKKKPAVKQEAKPVKKKKKK